MESPRSITLFGSAVAWARGEIDRRPRDIDVAVTGDISFDDAEVVLRCEDGHRWNTWDGGMETLRMRESVHRLMAEGVRLDFHRTTTAKNDDTAMHDLHLPVPAGVPLASHRVRGFGEVSVRPRERWTLPAALRRAETDEAGAWRMIAEGTVDPPMSTGRRGEWVVGLTPRPAGDLGGGACDGLGPEALCRAVMHAPMYWLARMFLARGSIFELLIRLRRLADLHGPEEAARILGRSNAESFARLQSSGDFGRWTIRRETGTLDWRLHLQYGDLWITPPQLADWLGLPACDAPDPAACHGE